MAPAARPQPSRTTDDKRGAIFRVALVVGLFGILWTAVPKIETWQRARFAERLADHAEASNDSVARLAVRRLVDTGLSSLDALVRLASSTNAAAADAARDAVLGQLTAWEIEFRMTGDSSVFVERVAVLAAALDRRARRFDPAARAWSEQVALRIASHCDRLPAEDAMGLLAHCDGLLSAPASVAAATKTSPASTEGTAAEPPVRVANVPGARARVRPMPAPAASASTPTTEPAPGTNTDFKLIDEPPVTPRAVEPTDSLPPSAGASGAAVTPPREAPLEMRPRPLPPPKAGASLVDVPSPQIQRAMLRKYRQLSDRELSHQHVVAGGYAAKVIEQAMAERKLRVAASVMTNSPSRMRPDPDKALVESVSKMPPAQARALLRKLVAEPSASAETRLQALTLLATSGDPQLVEIARNRALEDTDDRVADLATRLLREAETK